MTIVIFGAPKPYSAQCRDRVLIRSRYGVSMNVAGSTGGKFPVVSGMGGKLRAPRPPPYGPSRADFGARLCTRHNALDRGGRELAAVALAGAEQRRRRRHTARERARRVVHDPLDVGGHHP